MNRRPQGDVLLDIALLFFRQIVLRNGMTSESGRDSAGQRVGATGIGRRAVAGNSSRGPVLHCGVEPESAKANMHLKSLFLVLPKYLFVSILSNSYGDFS
jgi:hypothetical protein